MPRQNGSKYPVAVEWEHGAGIFAECKFFAPCQTGASGVTMTLCNGRNLVRDVPRAGLIDSRPNSLFLRHGFPAVPRKIPIVWNIQDYIGHRRISRLILLIALFWFGRNRRIAAACCSDDVRKDLTLVLKNRYLCSIATIHNTVDLQTFNPNGPIHDLNNSNPKAIRIGLIATYAKWKGQDVFIQAISLLRQDITEFQAYLIGGPIYDTSGSQWSASELQQLADHYGLQNRLQIIPFQANSADVMRSLDIVVHASTKPEPFGRVIAEAQACARCVVAVNSGGSAEAFDDGLTGLGVNRNDAQDLSAKLTQLLLDQILMKKLASHGPGFVSTRFDRRDLAAKWLNVYQAILP